MHTKIKSLYDHSLSVKSSCKQRRRSPLVHRLTSLTHHPPTLKTTEYSSKYGLQDTVTGSATILGCVYIHTLGSRRVKSKIHILKCHRDSSRWIIWIVILCKINLKENLIFSGQMSFMAPCPSLSIEQILSLCLPRDIELIMPVSVAVQHINDLYLSEGHYQTKAA